MRDINNFSGDVDQKEMMICNPAAVQIAGHYVRVIAAKLAQGDRETFTVDVDELSRTAAELLESAGVTPDDANICYTVRMAVRIVAKNCHRSFDMRSSVSDGRYQLTLTER